MGIDEFNQLLITINVIAIIIAAAVSYRINMTTQDKNEHQELINKYNRSSDEKFDIFC